MNGAAYLAFLALQSRPGDVVVCVEHERARAVLAGLERLAFIARLRTRRVSIEALFDGIDEHTCAVVAPVSLAEEVDALGLPTVLLGEAQVAAANQPRLTLARGLAWVDGLGPEARARYDALVEAFVLLDGTETR